MLYVPGFPRTITASTSFHCALRKLWLMNGSFFDIPHVLMHWLIGSVSLCPIGEKPFSCTHCNRAFADRSNLRAHLQTHSDVKKYQCKTCSRTFSRMSLLHKHEETGCSGSR